MKKLIIILKILGYICLAYSINLIYDGTVEKRIVID